MVYAGIATHFIPAAKFAAIAPRLAQGEPAAPLLESLKEDAGPAPLAEHRASIDRVFSASSVEAVVNGLGKEGAWGKKTALQIAANSPTSLKLTFRQMREGKNLDFDSCMRMEYRLTNQVVEGHDFYDGGPVTGIDKGERPSWQPATLHARAAAAIARDFAPLGANCMSPDGQFGGRNDAQRSQA